MKFQRVKKAADIELPGVITEALVTASGQLTRLTFRDAAGAVLAEFQSQNEYSGLQIFVPAPAKMVKKYRVVGSLYGEPFSKSFNEEYEASRFIKYEVTDDQSDLKVEEYEVEEED